ncbi:DUF3180 domain-containing protein [Gordonia sp. PP30]|uniref:DUF3180 domain-containing protein n=1 Tax=Gordonia sp. PP30 TaxID=2935861 RepID=UPI001FFE9CA3|nr:DUF3180 domain-containing protein [Gordonia sp. PP30]UQE75526.1 DUF3180 domain-containing protein [Gordonia sp. PP30]
MTTGASHGHHPDDEHKLGPTRVRDLLAVAVVAGLVLWVLARYHYGLFPSLPWPAGLTLYAAAVLEVVIGFLVRSRIAGGKLGPGEGQLHPISVARLVALAKASALVGAIALGGWAGLSVYLLAHRELDVARADLPAAVVGAVGGLLLAGAALWLEHCCRAPDDPSPDAPDTSPNPV